MLKIGKKKVLKFNKDIKMPGTIRSKTFNSIQSDQATQEASSSPTPPKLSNTGETLSKLTKTLDKKSKRTLLTIKQQLPQQKLPLKLQSKPTGKLRMKPMSTVSKLSSMKSRLQLTLLQLL
jgi:hypothetical protein